MDHKRNIGLPPLARAMGVGRQPNTILTLNSDHLPILLTIQTDNKHTIQQNRQSYTNYRKADWDKFTQDTEDAFSALQPPTDIHDANKTFTNILYQTGKKHIPVGRIRNTDKRLPQLISQNTLQDPSIPELNKEISTLISTNKTEIWREHIEKPWDHRRNTSTYWNTIHGLAHKRPPQQDNNSITFKDNTHINPKDIASAFNKQFINTIPHKTNTTNRKITRKVLCLQPTQLNITTEQVLEAIKNRNNSTEPDNINIKHFKTFARTDYSTSRTYTTLQLTTTRYLMFGNWPTSYQSLNLTKTSTLGRHTDRYPFYLLSQRHSRG